METARMVVDCVWTLTVALSVWIAHRRISLLEDKVK